MKLKGNHIPRGLIPMEKLFDQNDVAKYPKMNPAEDYIEDKNIGTEYHPKIIKLSKNFSAKVKEDYVKKYTDVFAWIYEEFKVMTPPSYNILSP